MKGRLLALIPLLAIHVFPATDAHADANVVDDDSGTLAAPHVTIPLSRGGSLLLAPVRINGVDAGLFFIDTGATYTVIDRTLAEHLKLPGVFERSANVYGGDGKAAVTLRAAASVSLGGEDAPLQLRDVLVAAVDLSALHNDVGNKHVRGMIGGDLLRRWPFTIDWHTAELTFHRRDAFAPPADAKRTNVHVTGGAPAVEVRLGDAEASGWFSLDTGAGADLTLTARQTRLMGASLRERPWRQTKMIGINGIQTSRASRFDGVELMHGRSEAVDVEYPWIEGPPGADRDAMARERLAAGTIGWGVLRNFRLTLDYASRSIWAEPATSRLPAEWARPDFDPKAPDALGDLPLVLASAAGSLEYVGRFLAAGADVNARDWRGATALHAAARGGSVEVVRALLKAGVDDVNAVTRHDETPLILAAGGRRDAGTAAVVKELLAAGARVDGTDTFGRTALIAAAEHGHLAVVEALLAAKADVRVSAASGGTALHAASACGHADVVDALIRAGADVNATNPPNTGGGGGAGATPLVAAAANGNTAVIERLLGAGARLEQPAPGHRSRALHAAATFGQTDAVRLLLSRGADPAAKDAKGRTPLDCAIEGEYAATVTVLYRATKAGR